MALFGQSIFFGGGNALSNGAPSAKIARCDFRSLKTPLKKLLGAERDVGLKSPPAPILGLLYWRLRSTTGEFMPISYVQAKGTQMGDLSRARSGGKKLCRYTQVARQKEFSDR
jgi:hypothetical protein